MRITKAWLRQAKSRINYRLKELVTIDEIGGEEALRKEFDREFPYRTVDQMPRTKGEFMRELIQHAIERAIPDAVVD